MPQAFGGKSTTEAGLVQQVDGRLLEHTRAHAMFGVVSAPGLDDNRLDALELQEVAKHQPGRPGTDDRHLCAHETCSPHDLIVVEGPCADRISGHTSASSSMSVEQISTLTLPLLSPTLQTFSP